MAAIVKRFLDNWHHEHHEQIISSLYSKRRFDKLGIPPEKATYVCQIYPDGDGQHYQFSYRIAGNILSGEAATGAGRCCHEPYPYGAQEFPEPHFDLEFWVTLPWVLDEPGLSNDCSTTDANLFHPDRN